jgi:hypothetical protein
VPITTADASLNLPGTVVGAAVFGSTAKTVTLASGTNLVFTVDNSVASASDATFPSGGTGLATGAFSGNTGNANWNAVLTQFNYDGGPKTITLNHLVVGLDYSVQLFALDDRSGGPSTRSASFQDPDDPSDVSASFAMGDNVYVLGSFTAPPNGTNATVNVRIQENLPTGPGYGNINAVVVRAAPSLVLDWEAGGQLQLQWAGGSLMQATNVTGPWSTNRAASPLVMSLTGAQGFFRVRFP